MTAVSSDDVFFVLPEAREPDAVPEPAGDRFGAVFRAVVFFSAGFLVVVFFTVDFFAVDFFVVDFPAVGFLDVVFDAAVFPFAAVFFAFPFAGGDFFVRVDVTPLFGVFFTVVVFPVFPVPWPVFFSLSFFFGMVLPPLTLTGRSPSLYQYP
jgi:hypothetical protein